MRRSSRARLSAYQANYDKIARDHIAHWREGRGNPFQDRNVVASHEQTTVEMAQRYVTADSVILDAGCGMGDLMLRFAGHDIQGIDMSADYIAIARQRGLRVKNGTLEKLPWPRATFSMVLCTDVLEHVLDLHRVVRELLRVLEPGGVVIARVPNEEVLTYDTEPYEFVHLRRFDEATVRILFGKIFGCELLEVIVEGSEIHVAARK